MCWLAVVVLVLSGCTTRWAVESHESHLIPLAGRTTYYWQGGALQSGDAIDLAAAQSVTSDIEASIVGRLSAKGYRQVPSEKDADMIVSYEARVGPSTVTTDEPAATGWSGDTWRFAADVPQKRMTTNNAVVVVIDDPVTRRVVWRGVVEDEIRVSSTQHALDLVVTMTDDIAKQIPECRPPPQPSAARL